MNMNMAHDKCKNILILGGSYAGVATAHYTLKHVIPCLPDKTNYRVVLVSSSSHFMCRPTCPRALISKTSLPRDKIFVPLSTAFDQYPSSAIVFYHGTVVTLDHSASTVSIVSSVDDNSEIKLHYHALVIATGATATSPLMGLFGDHSKTVEAWDLFQKKIPTAKSIIITGGGPTGVETAGELGEHLNSHEGASPEPKTAITLITKSEQLLPDLPLSLTQKAEAQLAKLGVSVVKGRCVEKVVSVDSKESNSAGRTLERLNDTVRVHLDSGETLQADLYIPATGVVPNTSYLDQDLLNEEGYVKVDPSSLRVESAGPRVYALGHVCTSKPRAIHAILNQAPIVGENLKQDLLSADKTKYRSYKAESATSQLVIIGKKGVGMFQGWKVPSFFVWLIKGRDYWLGMTPPMWNGKQFSKAI